MSTRKSRQIKAGNEIEAIPVKGLIPYAKNSRTHDEHQIDQIAASITEYGFTNPVLIDEGNMIIAGHGRVLAAERLDMETVPCIRLSYLTDTQKRAYVIADNKLALNAGWNEALLMEELVSLQAEGFDISLTGFDEADIVSLDDLPEDDATAQIEKYTRKIESPIYEPSGIKPKLTELYDLSKTEELRAAIREADLDPEIEAFLLAAAARHSRFRYDLIAEFYAQASPEVQALMEASALVIIDFQQAIEEGFVQVSKEVMQYLRADYD